MATPNNIITIAVDLSTLDTTSEVMSVLQSSQQVIGTAVITGPAGPNLLTSTTATNLTGILKGNSTMVGVATAGTDYLLPTGSGAALTGLTQSQIAGLATSLAAKQNSLTLTTTGSSGAATLVGSTLNIPQYSGGGGGGTVTSVALSGGTTGLTVTGSPITGAGTITLSGTLAVANGGTGNTTGTATTNANMTGDVTSVGNATTYNNALPVTKGGTGATSNTGSGANVLATSPVLVSPSLGTPTALVLTNATGLPIGGISATGTPSSTTYLRGDGTWSAVAGGFTNPMTTAGDIIYGGTSGTPTRLGIGSSTSLLMGGATAPVWTAATGTGVPVLATSPAIVTPTIASFVNANHNHTNAAGGGQLSLTAAVTGILPVANGGTGSGTQNFVDLSTAQAAIAGAKTWTGATNFSNTVKITADISSVGPQFVVIDTAAIGTSNGAGIAGRLTVSPTAAGQTLAFYLGGANGNNSGGMLAASTQAWTVGSAQGTQVQILTTPNGSATRTIAVTFDHDQSAKFAAGVGFNNVTPVAIQGATVDLGTVMSNVGLRNPGTAYVISTSGSVTTGVITMNSAVRKPPVLRTAAVTLTSGSPENNPCDATAAAFAATLPSAAAAAGQTFSLTKIDSTANAVTITRAGTDTINGATTYVLGTQYKTATFYSDGTSKWIITANN